MTLGLCDACKAIPFREIHDDDAEDFGPWTLGTLTELRLRQECPFCQLLVQRTCDVRIPDFRFEKYWEEKAITIRRLKDGFNSDFLHLGSKIYFTSGKGNQGRDVNAGQINPDLVNKWLHICNSDHLDTCSSPAVDSTDPKLASFRLIDVHRLCIVDGSISFPYVALSYVWGQAAALRLTTQNRADLMALNGLRAYWDQLPLTIQDAIQLVLSIGQKYVWVDSLCLVQNDPEDMMTGIQMMNTIYQQSALTLIAASGTDANHGLPGVRNESRKVMQTTCEVLPGIKLALFYEMETLLSMTKYNTRAWTFQERYFAHRTLIFLNNMVYFQCRKCSWAEEIEDDLDHQDYSTLFSILQDDLSDSYDELSNALQYYSSRELTYQTDCLNAMAGVCQKVYQKAKCSFLQGIPVSSFDLYIVFWCDNPLKCSVRRSGFPSWSWTGWIAAVGWVYLDDKNQWLIENTWIVWYKRSPSGILSLVWDPAAFADAPHGDITYRTQQRFEPVPGLNNINTSRVMPTWDLPAGSASRSYYLLQFWTLSVNLKLWKDHDNRYDGLETSYDLFDSQKNYCGVILLDFVSPAIVDGDTIELIIISRNPPSNSQFHLKEPSEGKADRALYWAMYVEWKEGIAERRGMAQIYSNAAIESFAPGPIWKEVILG